MRTARYTYVVERGGDGSARCALYDRTEDPYQLRDVAGERPEVVRRLRGELRGWLEATGDRWRVSP